MYTSSRVCGSSHRYRGAGPFQCGVLPFEAAREVPWIWVARILLTLLTLAFIFGGPELRLYSVVGLVGAGERGGSELSRATRSGSFASEG